MTETEKQTLIKKRYDEKIVSLLGDVEKDGFVGISGLFYSTANLFSQLGFGGKWLATLGYLLWKQEELYREAEKEVNNE